jgi:hypothetical protein
MGNCLIFRRSKPAIHVRGGLSFAFCPSRVTLRHTTTTNRALPTGDDNMSIKTLLAALVLTAAPGLAMAECSWGKTEQVTMSCAEGMMWDADSASCVPVVSS